MKRDIYKGKLNELRDLKQARIKEPLIDLVQKMARQVNQRFYRLEKANVGLGDTAYRFAVQETDKKKPRYPTYKKTLENMSLQELYELGIQLNVKIASKTSTIRGLKEVNRQREIESLRTLHSDVGVSKDISIGEQNRWRDFLNRGGGEIMNNKYLDSYQIREDWYNYTYEGGVSIKKFLEVYNKNTQDNFDDVDYGKIRRTLINLKKKVR